VLEQTDKLEAVGVGLQLSPNATRILVALGLGDRLASSVVAPQAVRIMSAGSGTEIVRFPFHRGKQRYGAPFWTFHRGDLHGALVEAAAAEPNITLRLGIKVDNFVNDGRTVGVLDKTGAEIECGTALIGADGIWSNIAKRLPSLSAPHFTGHIAWRTLVSAETVPEEFRTPLVHLWVGPKGHLVHYPVKGGQLINIVATAHGEWNEMPQTALSEGAEILHHFAQPIWTEKAQTLMAVPDRWHKWPLYHRTETFRGGIGPITLIGDAAHPILPFLALGAGLAIEDAVVLADCLRSNRGEVVKALRQYENSRRQRVERVRRASATLGLLYGLRGPQAFIRNIGMRILGGERLLKRYDWIYSWQPPKL
jgi:salicylate hydroxylase